jgi:hypothetical protein
MGRRDVETHTYRVESATVPTGDFADQVEMTVEATDVDGDPRRVEDLDILPGTPMTADGRSVGRLALLAWIVAARGVRLEADVDVGRYSRIVAARFTAGAPAG